MGFGWVCDHWMKLISQTVGESGQTRTGGTTRKQQRNIAITKIPRE